MKKILLFLFIATLFYSCRKQPVDPLALPDTYSNQGLGASAHDVLSADKYTTLNIQIHYMPGYQLEATAIDNITIYLNNLCNKPGGITISQSQIAAYGDTLDPTKVAGIEKQNRTAFTSGGALSIYILVTDGYDTSESTLGFAYRNTSLVLFGRNIFDHSGHIGEINRTSLETSVLEHELGHIMGLVNIGTPMVANHQDLPHGNHCNNTKCLMYYAMELHKGLGMLSSVPPLDSNCLADLHANGGK
jgi:hypothetical protein